MIDERFAKQWAGVAGVELDQELAPDGQQTRGELLNRLYDRVQGK